MGGTDDAFVCAEGVCREMDLEAQMGIPRDEASHFISIWSTALSNAAGVGRLAALMCGQRQCCICFEE